MFSISSISDVDFDRDGSRGLGPNAGPSGEKFEEVLAGVGLTGLGFGIGAGLDSLATIPSYCRIVSRSESVGMLQFLSN